MAAAPATLSVEETRLRTLDEGGEWWWRTTEVVCQ